MSDDVENDWGSCKEERQLVLNITDTEVRPKMTPEKEAAGEVRRCQKQVREVIGELRGQVVLCQDCGGCRRGGAHA